jgi:hypothetical protein
MAYNINKSNSDPVTIPTGAIDNQFDIPLIGQDAINYGDDLALAFVRLLENFANTSAPSFGSARTTGQLWYDTSGSGTLNIYDGTQFVAIPKASEVVDNTSDENISGDKIFNGTPSFNGGDVSNPPFNVDSSFVVSGLNADLLDGQEGAYYASAASVVGKQSKWVPAIEMFPEDGAAGADGLVITDTPGGDTAETFTPNRVALTAGRPMLNVWDFDDSVEEAVQFTMAFPDNWDEGVIKFQVFWTANSTAGDDVIWQMEAIALDSTDSLDSAFTTTTTVTGTNHTVVNSLNRTAESAAFAIDGGPTAGNLVAFRFARLGGNVSDTLTGDARLIGVKVLWLTDTPTIGATI